MNAQHGLLRFACCACCVVIVGLLACAGAVQGVRAALPSSQVQHTNLIPGWRSVTRIDAAVARYWHTAVWTGSEMIVFGGVGDPYRYLSDGARYNPAADSWAPLPAAGAPSGRIFHTAVWTGSEMIVWGGHGDEGSTNSGARYNPTTDRWSPLATAGAPSPRYGHTAVWTGSEMVVWGGTAANDEVLGDGARYDPASDTWTPLPTANAPCARRNHTAVWTGTEMIVWGGSSGSSNQLASGARFNPASDGWTPLPTSGAPYDGPFHTAFWTGSEMLVWGVGAGGKGGSLNDGARYDPANNRWAPLSTSGAPSERADYAAVWTGSEMFVWGGVIGGADGSLIRNDGARYNPASDTWMPLPTSDAPTGRKLHTAVWTGSEMIVWGGLSGDATLGDGARLRGYYSVCLPFYRTAPDYSNPGNPAGKIAYEYPGWLPPDYLEYDVQDYDVCSMPIHGTDVVVAVHKDLNAVATAPPRDEFVKFVYDTFAFHWTVYGGYPYEKYVVKVLSPSSTQGWVTATEVGFIIETRPDMPIGWFTTCNLPCASAYKQFVTHEMFHAWNGEIIRDVGGHVNYIRPELWFVQGATQYYGYRATPHELQLYEIRLKDSWRRYTEWIGTKYDVPINEMSRYEVETGEWQYGQNYTDKGACLFYLMDKELMSQGKSLDDLMAHMYENFGLQGRRFVTNDILVALNGVTGSDWTSFFNKYVYGTVPLPLDGNFEYLRH